MSENMAISINAEKSTLSWLFCSTALMLYGLLERNEKLNFNEILI